MKPSSENRRTPACITIDPGAPAPSPPDSSDRISMMSKKQLARLLSVNPWTIDRWRKSDASFPSPVWVTDTTPRWYCRDIERWLASKHQGGIAPEWRRSHGKAEQG
jgi:predicted DNA-binding transcriptional regulator AlpA